MRLKRRTTVFKHSFDVYKRNLGSVLLWFLAVSAGALVTLLGGGLVLTFFNINNYISVDAQVYLLVVIGISLGALGYQALHTHSVKKELRESAKWRFDQVLEKGVRYAIKEAYKDLKSSGQLHSSKLALLFAQANSAVTIATLGDMDVNYVLKGFSDTLEAGKPIDATPADLLSINVSSWGFGVSIRLGGKYLPNPRDSEPES